LRKRSVLLLPAGLMSCALMHPSCVFTTGVLLVPYLVWLVWRMAIARSKTHSRKTGVLAVAILLVAVAAVWAACYNVPSIRSIGFWKHFAYKSRHEALLRVAFVGFKDVPPQRTLALLVWIGVAYSLYRTRYLWLTGGFLSFSYLYFLCATTDGTLKHWLANFWYSDYNRLSASACLVGVPLAALGFYAVVRTFQRLFEVVSAHLMPTPGVMRR